jgi:hypothetical protein
MEPITTRDRAEPTEGRAALMRRAADLLGSERLAKALDISPRSLYYFMNGQRTVKDGVLADTRQLLIAQRQATGELLQDFREEEAETTAAREAAEPTPAQRRAAKAAERQLLTEARANKA